MKLLFNTLIATSVLSFALTAQAKIGDTFIDPELGKITVKAPNIELKEYYQLIRKVNGKEVFIDHPQIRMDEKTRNANSPLYRQVKKLTPTMSEKEIVEATKVFIKGFKELRELRKTVYLEGYNKYIIWSYKRKIEDAQREFKYQFLDYFMKIKGTPEFDKLKKEINFSSQILDNLKLYEEE